MIVRRLLQSALGIGAIAAALFVGARMRQVSAAATLPTAPARQGDFLVITRCRGELTARRSVQVTAPNNVPDLRIVWLAPQNAMVKEGDVVIRFDQSSARQQLQEKEAALSQAQATLEQAVAEARITAEGDQRDLSWANYDVERAKLEVVRQELKSPIDGATAQVNLGLSDKKLSVQQANVALHQASAGAKTASLTRVRDQAQYEVDLTKSRLAKMEVKSPSNGVLVFQPNYSQGWMNARPFKVGDQAWPGATIAQVPDLTTLAMEGKVEEIDRGRIANGDEVHIRLDALPELTLNSKLSELSSMTQISFDWPPTYSFRAFARIEKPDSRLRPDMNGTMDVIIQRIPAAISVPAKAVYTKNGKPIVYVPDKGGYTPRAVQVIAHNPDEVAVTGLSAGTSVTLVEPDRENLAKQEGKQ